MKIYWLFLSLLFLSTGARASTTCVSGTEWSGDKSEKLDSRMSSVARLAFDEKHKTVKVTLRNTTKQDLSFVDSIRVAKDAPEFLSIMVRDKAGNVVTNGGRGYTSFNGIVSERSSENEVALPKELTTLHPGEEISRTVKIADVIKGTQKGWRVAPENLDNFSVRFQFRLYRDLTHRYYTECESSWYYSKNHKILDAPNPFNSSKN
jgi:hypothetical protein